MAMRAGPPSMLLAMCHLRCLPPSPITTPSAWTGLGAPCGLTIQLPSTIYQGWAPGVPERTTSISGGEVEKRHNSKTHSKSTELDGERRRGKPPGRVDVSMKTYFEIKSGKEAAEQSRSRHDDPDMEGVVLRRLAGRYGAMQPGRGLVSTRSSTSIPGSDCFPGWHTEYTGTPPVVVCSELDPWSSSSLLLTARQASTRFEDPSADIRVSNCEMYLLGRTLDIHRVSQPKPRTLTNGMEPALMICMPTCQGPQFFSNRTNVGEGADMLIFGIAGVTAPLKNPQLQIS